MATTARAAAVATGVIASVERFGSIVIVWIALDPPALGHRAVYFDARAFLHVLTARGGQLLGERVRYHEDNEPWFSFEADAWPRT